MREPTRHDPFLALRQPSFQRYVLGRLLTAMGMFLLNAVVFWQVYQLSESAFQLGMIGVARFLPSLGLGLVGGAAADSFDKKRIVIACQATMLAAGVGLFVLTLSDDISLPWIYAAVFVIAVAGAFEAPARQALLPGIVTREAFPNAITVGTTFQQLGFVTGPALGGMLIALDGPALAYAAYIGLYVLSIVAMVSLRLLPVEFPRRGMSLGAIREGVQFVRHRQVVLGSMTLDMFAVIFGGATALLPIYAEEILDVGALGYGLLASALDIGALLTTIALVWFPPIRRVGRALFFAVLFYGLFTIAFGLSRSFPLSLLLYMGIGAADAVSVVMRQTTIQLATPDELRGRVTSVNMLFIGTSNQLGTVESGFVAALTNATFAVVSGGAGCLAVLGAVWATMPELRRYRIDHAPGDEAANPAGAAAG